MSRINMKNWISQVIQSKERMAIPIMTYPGIELTGKSVYEAVTNLKQSKHSMINIHRQQLLL